VESASLNILHFLKKSKHKRHKNVVVTEAAARPSLKTLAIAALAYFTPEMLPILKSESMPNLLTTP